MPLADEPSIDMKETCASGRPLEDKPSIDMKETCASGG